MIVTQRPHYELEIVKWVVLLTLAMLIVAMLSATQLHGEMAGSPPEMLPGSVQREALPMSATEAELPRAEQSPAGNVATRLQQVLLLQREQRWDAALEAWDALAADVNVEPWRSIAVAHARLQAENLEPAVEVLTAAAGSEIGHPVVHYYLGLARWRQAEAAENWYDVPLGETVLVSTHVPGIVPNSRSMFRLKAKMEFTTAVRNEVYVDQRQPLVGHLDPHCLPPTVGAFLDSLDAANYVAEAHRRLAELSLEQYSLTATEAHLDEAVLRGAEVSDLYRKLGRAYETTGRYLDAARAYAKQMLQDDLPLEEFTELEDVMT